MSSKAKSKATSGKSNKRATGNPWWQTAASKNSANSPSRQHLSDVADYQIIGQGQRRLNTLQSNSQPGPGSGGGILSVGQPAQGAFHGGKSKRLGLGYHPDLPDARDVVISPKNNDAPAWLNEVYRWLKSKSNGNAYLLGKSNVPQSIDLRNSGHFSSVEDQGEVGSCTAQAVVGMLEFQLHRGISDKFDLSRMFLYKTTRRLLGWSGDTGAYIRTTIKAAIAFGVPPEDYWPYEESLLDEEPDAFLFAYAKNYQGTHYARLDKNGGNPSDTIHNIEMCIADGFPVAFGFPVYESIYTVTKSDHNIPYPTGSHDRLLGGHAVLAVGYDKSKEAILIRNSWGTNWGDAGYAWLPYEYVKRGLAVDFWTIFNMTWLNAADFS
ncbi:MAG TPA: C1 family peptidase [Kiritimatiellia bacterium]|nr:C1 family peptidase [Kiritimatiellia bacterium]